MRERRIRPGVEGLEDRTLPAGLSLTWIGGDLFHAHDYPDPNNWHITGTTTCPSRGPTLNDDIIFDNHANTTCIIPNGETDNCHSLTVKNSALKDTLSSLGTGGGNLGLQIDSGGILDLGSGTSVIEAISTANTAAIGLECAVSAGTGGILFQDSGGTLNVNGPIAYYSYTGRATLGGLEVGGNASSTVNIQNSGGTGAADPWLRCNVVSGFNPTGTRTVDGYGTVNVGTTYSGYINDSPNEGTTYTVTWTVNHNGSQVSNLNFTGESNGSSPTCYCGVYNGSQTGLVMDVYGGTATVNSGTIGDSDVDWSGQVVVDYGGTFNANASNKWQCSGTAEVKNGTMYFYSQCSTLWSQGLTIDASTGTLTVASSNAENCTIGSTYKLDIEGTLNLGNAATDFPSLAVTTSGGGEIKLGSTAVVNTNCNLASNSQCGALQGSGAVEIVTGAKIKATARGTWNNMLANYAIVTGQSMTGSVAAGDWTLTGFPNGTTDGKFGTTLQIHVP